MGQISAAVTHGVVTRLGAATRLLSTIGSHRNVRRGRTGLRAARFAASCAAFLYCGEHAVHAADLSGVLPTKAPPPTAPAAYDWTGLSVGAHLGYATGSSDWTATQGDSAAPSLAGSLDLFNGFNGFGGTGSYLLGLQAGYNYMSPSRFVLGGEADVSFPNLLSGNQTISSPLIGLANYQDQVEMSGTVRGRIGYAPGNWLFYVTGGFAYSFDHLTRTQIDGVPVGGTAAPSTVENLFMVPRLGGVVGAGVEFALTPRWMARLEYLYA
ncbi:MAG TPA: outer membrane beta-barrel protein, partial [Xanthobacteraceae bacterium]